MAAKKPVKMSAAQVKFWSQKIPIADMGRK